MNSVMNTNKRGIITRERECVSEKERNKDDKNHPLYSKQATTEINTFDISI